MAHKQIKIDTFCKIFKEFLDDLQRLKPNDSSVYLLSTTVSALTILNPELLVRQYIEYTDIYTDKILAKDESFFLNNLQNDVISGYEWVNDEINKVKELWPSASNETKENLWKYFINFSKLGRSILKDNKK